MFKIFHKKIKKDFSRGFTLVEMAIVTAIFGILTAIVVFKYGDFTSNLLVTNMAYEIALTARQAQVFGVGARGYTEAGGEADFEFPYGVYFNLNDGSSNVTNETKNFIFFVDRDNDQICDNSQPNNTSPCTCSTGDECLNRLSLQRNIRITELKLSGTGGTACTSDNGIETSVAVSFKRPSPEARIRRQTQPNKDFNYLQIKIEAPGASVNPSFVLIRKNGQISVSSKDVCGVSVPVGN